jgi:hypothetical protein
MVSERELVRRWPASDMWLLWKQLTQVRLTTSVISTQRLIRSRVHDYGTALQSQTMVRLLALSLSPPESMYCDPLVLEIENIQAFHPLSGSKLFCVNPLVWYWMKNNWLDEETQTAQKRTVAIHSPPLAHRS